MAENQPVDSKNAEDPKFQSCTYKDHKNKGVSIYPRDKVPIEFFRKDPDNPKSELLNSCFDCRKYKANINQKSRTKKRAEAAERDEFICGTCHKSKPFD